jgi:hypothetical protein
MLLNWRNKRGSYTRIPFSDVFADVEKNNTKALERFRNAIVIIGPTAPGISTLKGTASSPLTDDNLILATAIDDLTAGTWLRPIPVGITSLASLLLVIFLAYRFSIGSSDKQLNRYFVVAQLIVAGITVVAISYTNYLVDLSGAFFFGLTYFSIAKTHAWIETNSRRGHPTYAALPSGPNDARLIILGFGSTEESRRASVDLRGRFEALLGVERVFHIDNLLDSGQLLSSVGKQLSFLLIAPPSPDASDASREVDALVFAAQKTAMVRNVVLSPTDAQSGAEQRAMAIAHEIFLLAAQMLLPDSRNDPHFENDGKQSG